jgi:hypothetical protein
MRCRLKHIESGRDVVFVNTHLDHEVRAQQQQQLDGARRRRAPPLGAQAVCAPELDPAPFFTHTLPHPNATHTSPPPSPPPPPRTRWRRRRRRRRWQGEQPRVRGAQLIVNRIPEKAPDCPVILVGDLNAGGAAREHATAACARAACAAVQASPPHQACCSAADPACVGHLPPADATPPRPPTPPPPARARHTSHVTRHTPRPPGNDTECYQVLTQFFQDASKCEGCGCHEGLLPSGSSTFCGFNDDNDSVIVSGCCC